MKPKAHVRKLAKFLAYLLGRRPDEFGLVANADGYIKIKELLKAIHEEEGWRHIRQANLQEVLYSLPSPPFEIEDTLIRAKNPDHIPLPKPCPHPPKFLYTCIRTKAHLVVDEKGIMPTKHPRVLLSSDSDMALRIGRRIDPSPVLLTVQVEKALQNEVLFDQAGETLYLADAIPANCFTGPPLPKTETDKKSDSIRKGKQTQPEHHQMPDYKIWPSETLEKRQKRQDYQKRKKQKAREREKRRLRKLKRNSGYYDET